MTAITVAVVAADRVRGAFLRRVCAFRGLRPLVVDPRHRLVGLQTAAVLSAAGLALRAPLISLWLGAALFGVPHVVAGFRAVAVRRRSTRVALGCAAVGVLVGVAQLAGGGVGTLRAFVLLFATALGWEMLAARRPPPVTATVLAAITGATVAALRAPQLAVVVLAHLHGLGSLVYFGVSARRRRLPFWPLALGVAAFSVAALTGSLDGAMATTLFAPRGAARSIIAEALGSAFPHATPVLFHRALVLYAFGQSLHFAAWLKLLPDVDRPFPTPKTVRRALADLRAELGRLTSPLLLLTALSIVLLLTGGGVARETYFALTYFHVGLEGAALLRLCLGRLPDRRRWAHPAAVETRVAA